MLQVYDREHWAFLEIDRGTQPLKRYAAQVRRYARLWLSKTWPSVYPTFPALQVVSITAARAAAIAELAADVIDQFDQLPYERLRDGMYVAATSEAELVADPFGAIWRPAYGPRDARHAWWCVDGPLVLIARPRSGVLCGPLRRSQRSIGAKRSLPRTLSSPLDAAVGSHCARGGTVPLRMGSNRAAAHACPTASERGSPSSTAAPSP